MTALRAEGCGIALRAMSFICRSAASVTGFTFVSPKPHDKVPEPPFPGRGCRRQATEDRGVSSLLKIRTYPQPYRAAPFRSGKQKEDPFMGRLRANFSRLGNPMQDCQLRKEPALRDLPSRPHRHSERSEESRYLPLMRQSTVNTCRREGTGG